MPDETDKYQEVVQLFEQLGNKQSVARQLGVTRSTVQSRLEAAARRGLVPKNAGADARNAPGFQTTQTTVQFDAAGNVIQEWRRSSPTDDLREAVLEELSTRLTGKIKVPSSPKKLGGALGILPIFDSHMGALAVASECGQNFDTRISEHLLRAHAAEQLAQMRGKVKEIHVILGGDVMHSDTRKGQTEKGTPLDVDTRHHCVVRACRITFCEIITAAASVAPVKVHVLLGNHDPNGMIWMQEVLHAAFDHVKNVEIVDCSEPRHYFRFGSVLIGMGHGDGAKERDLPMRMAIEARPHGWDTATCYRFFRGHVHHRRKLEIMSEQDIQDIIVHTLPALCFSDYWHTKQGYSTLNRESVGMLLSADGYEYREHSVNLRRFMEAYRV